jgi:hypothetical protein
MATPVPQLFEAAVVAAAAGDDNPNRQPGDYNHPPRDNQPGDNDQSGDESETSMTGFDVDGDAMFDITLKHWGRNTGDQFQVTVTETTTIMSVKLLAANVLKLHPMVFDLMYGSEVTRNDQTLRDYHMVDGGFLIIKMNGIKGGGAKRKKVDDGVVSRQVVVTKLSESTFPMTGEVPCVKEALTIVDTLLKNPKSLTALETLVQSHSPATINKMLGDIRSTNNITTRHNIMVQALFAPVLTPLQNLQSELGNVTKIIEDTTQ